MANKRGRRDYLGNIANSDGRNAGREGDGHDVKSERAGELTAFALRGFGGFGPRIATGVYGAGLYEALLHIPPQWVTTIMEFPQQMPYNSTNRQIR